MILSTKQLTKCIGVETIDKKQCNKVSVLTIVSSMRNITEYIKTFNTKRTFVEYWCEIKNNFTSDHRKQHFLNYDVLISMTTSSTLHQDLKKIGFFYADNNNVVTSSY